MKKIILLLTILLIATGSIVIAKISFKKNVDIQKEEVPNPALLKSSADLTAWD